MLREDAKPIPHVKVEVAEIPPPALVVNTDVSPAPTTLELEENDEVTSESEDEATLDETPEEREARENERRLVLEAAGIVVKKDKAPPPRPRKRRRPAPAVPSTQRLSTASIESEQIEDEAPAVPEKDNLDDAFDRYEQFKASQSANRISVASSSFEMNSPTVSVAPSVSHDVEGGSRSYLRQLLGRKTPVESERRVMPTISGPIVIGRAPSDAPSQDAGSASPSFGSVGAEPG